MFVVDQIIENSEFYKSNLAADCLMMIMLGLKERTYERFEELFNEIGFKIALVNRIVFKAVIETVAFNILDWLRIF